MNSVLAMHHLGFAGAQGVRGTARNPAKRRVGGSITQQSLLRRTSPCVLLISARSIAPPSASTASSACSIRNVGGDGPDLSALQHRADRRERLPRHHGRRRLRRERPAIEAKENTLTVKGEKKTETDGEGVRIPLSRHRRARFRAPLPARRPRRGEGRQPRERPPPHRPRPRDSRGDEAPHDRDRQRQGEGRSRSIRSLPDLPGQP